ncbi:uncharacterized protein LOC124175025 isoform X4 [Neodiprion fabricii]|uniref:uncharacterized protein LOC124175025 isoform X4 n=1 Tax=Neodiprion fabricii TaxID=2872261 RepID=UPI001ED9235C|nr:uncharacterized protein LOC124175025 isoform X4 [Neodiprion fabricii]
MSNFYFFHVTNERTKQCCFCRNRNDISDFKQSQSIAKHGGKTTSGQFEYQHLDDGIAGADCRRKLEADGQDIDTSTIGSIFKGLLHVGLGIGQVSSPTIQRFGSRTVYNRKRGRKRWVFPRGHDVGENRLHQSTSRGSAWPRAGEYHELLGQSLYTFVCPEDYAELRSGLTPDETQTSTSNAIQANDETSNSSEESQSPKTERQFTEQRRSFSIRMSQKALNKRDHGQYECLQISGLLRLADACGNQSNNNNNNRSRPREINGTSNDIIFVGIARLVKRRTITELSLLEATKDEYVTRHLIDGRIIFCDHRISVVAGYMAEEVSGLSAFKFMHKEDVRWTMIGLRQMYDRGEGFGSSCYRLLSRTGQFIYLRTHGYLEYDKTTQSVESFVCVNTLVTEKEGIELVREMKNRFSATVSGPAKVAIPLPSSITPPVQDSQWTDPKLTVEDPAQLEDAVKQLISNLPSPASGISVSPSPITHNQFYKAAVYSTKLPPASIQAHKMGMKSLQLNSPSDEESSHVLTDGHKTREYSSAQTDSASIDEPQCDRDIDDTRTSFLYTQTNTTVEESLGERETEDIVLGLGDDHFAEEKPNLEKNIHMTDANRNLSLQNCGAAGSRISDNVREKRVSRRRATHGAVGKVQMDKCNKTIRTKSTGTASHRTHEAVRDANSSSNNRCIRPDSARKYSGSNFDEKILTDETQYTRKRSRSIEEVPVSVSKRKTNKMGSASSSNDFVLSNEDINYYPTVGSPLIPRLDDNELGELSGEANLIGDIVLESDAGLSRELATASCLPSIDGYQQSNTGFSCSSVTGYQINEFHDDYSGDVLSPSLDVDTDLMKTNFEDLQSVVCNEKTIDEAHINEFTACNQAVNEEIRKTQFQLEQSIALRESQLSVLKRDLDNPALLAQRKNLKQIEAEHNETKQMLITLQQDHYNLQVNVQQNIGV